MKHMGEHQRIPIWKNVSDELWSDWNWQISNTIESLEQLENIIELHENEKKGIIESGELFRMRISPHIALIMKSGTHDDSLRKQFIPSIMEVDSIDDSTLFDDVNADDRYSPLKGLTHRYPTKVLVFPSNFCGCYCRYCFRRKLKRESEELLSNDDFIEIVKYIKAHPEINEVIFSGGDPLVVSDSKIEYFLNSLADVETVKVIRFHTRMPITIPYRITDEFVSILRKYNEYYSIYFVIHVDTKREISSQSIDAIKRLTDIGILCFASCPLLYGINADEKVLSELWMYLIENRIKPYYLFHSDPVKGLKHFLVPLSRGLDIMRNIYDNISGLAVPHYCLNVPDGGGHVLLAYPYVKEISDNEYEIVNFEGKITKYIETEDII